MGLKLRVDGRKNVETITELHKRFFMGLKRNSYKLVKHATYNFKSASVCSLMTACKHKFQ